MVELQSANAMTTALEITNLLGQQVFVSTLTVQKGLNTIPLEVSSLPAGTYLVSFTDASGKKYIEKLIKN